MLLLALLLVPQPVIDLLGSAAAALSAGNPAGFMQAFDRSMPGYRELEKNVTALAAQCDVVSSIDFLADNGTEARRTLELDWFLEIRERTDTGAVTRRRQTVKCVVERRGRKWKVVSLEPLSLFVPPRP